MFFVAKSQCPDALTQKLGHLVFDQARQPIVRKTPRQSLNESHPQVHSPQKHRPAVAAEVAPRKIRRHFPASVGLKLENLLLTLCHSEVLLVDCSNTNLSGLGRELRYFLPACEFSGLAACSSRRVPAITAVLVIHNIRVVRHPMYSGGLLMILATPLALGSLCSAVGCLEPTPSTRPGSCFRE